MRPRLGREISLRKGFAVGLCCWATKGKGTPRRKSSGVAPVRPLRRTIKQEYGPLPTRGSVAEGGPLPKECREGWVNIAGKKGGTNHGFASISAYILPAAEHERMVGAIQPHRVLRRVSVAGRGAPTPWSSGRSVPARRPTLASLVRPAIRWLPPTDDAFIHMKMPALRTPCAAGCSPRCHRRHTYL